MRRRVLVAFLVLLISSCWSVSATWAGKLNSGLVVHYLFDSGASGAMANGNVHGPALTNNRFGSPKSSFRFDGVDDWVEIDDFDCVLNFDRDWSLNLWVYLDGTGKHTVFFAGADGDARSKQFAVASQYVKMSHKADTGSDWRVNFKEASHNSWHMYTVTWSKQGHLKVFVDGALQGEDQEGELADFCPKNEPVIGGVNFFRHKTQFFKGSIDDFRIYDRILPESEIRELYSITE